MAESVKYALKKLYRTPEGQLKHYFIDMNTGKVINDLTGYVVYDQGKGLKNPTEKEKESKVTPKEILSEGTKNTFTAKNEKDLDLYGNSIGTSKTTTKISPNVQKAVDKQVRTEENNYKYVPQSLIGTVARVIPGISIPATMLEAARRANNVAAINAARKDLGLPELTVAEKAKAFAKDSFGYVGDVVAKGIQYSVGLDPSRIGPDNRSMWSPKSVKEQMGDEKARLATEEEVAQAQKEKTSMRIVDPLQATTQDLKESFNKALDVEETSKLSGISSVAGTLSKNIVSQNITPAGVNVVTPKVQGLLDKASGIKESLLSAQTKEAMGAPYSGKQMKSIGDPISSAVTQTQQDAEHRPGDISAELAQDIGISVNNVLGPNGGFTVTSGTGEYGGHRHRASTNDGKYGRAADGYFTYNGKTVEDKEIIGDILADFAARNPSTAGVGYGKGYMGTTNVHIGYGGAATWGKGSSKKGMLSEDPAMYDKIENARKTGIALPTYMDIVPDKRPSFAAPTDVEIAVNNENLISVPDVAYANPGSLKTFVQDSMLESMKTQVPADFGMPKDAEKAKALEQALASVNNLPVFNSLGFKGNIIDTTESQTKELMQESVKDIIQTPVNSIPAEENPTKPDFNREDIDFVAYTIAGELAPQTLKDLTSIDEEARQEAVDEVANMIATIEARYESGKYADEPDPLAKTLNPAHYNSLMASSLKNTEFNYNKYGTQLSKLVEDYALGKIKPTVEDATHYRATYLTPPAWEKYAMAGLSKIGNHYFSTIAMPGTDKPEFERVNPGSFKASLLGTTGLGMGGTKEGYESPFGGFFGGYGPGDISNLSGGDYKSAPNQGLGQGGTAAGFNNPLGGFFGGYGPGAPDNSSSSNASNAGNNGSDPDTDGLGQGGTAAGYDSPYGGFFGGY